MNIRCRFPYGAGAVASVILVDKEGSVNASDSTFFQNWGARQSNAKSSTASASSAALVVLSGQARLNNVKFLQNNALGDSMELYKMAYMTNTDWCKHSAEVQEQLHPQFTSGPCAKGSALERWLCC